MTAAIKQYDMLQSGDRVLVGLSGGADSVSLLHSLVTLSPDLGISVRAVHVNHCIRGESALRDQSYCEQLCQKLDIPIDSFVIDVPALAAERSQGLEQCGRDVRYECFAKVAEQYNCRIATAHTLSDSCETVIFNIARGCGTSGLSGIPPVRGRIIRPLIGCTRADVEQYCCDNGLSYMTDETNSDTAYSRNLIRHEIIPRLERLNPDFGAAIGRLTMLTADDALYINGAAEAALEQSRCVDSGYIVERLLGYDIAVLRRCIVIMLDRLASFTPAYRHVELIIELMQRGGGALELNDRWVCRIDKGKVLVSPKCQSSPSPAERTWEISLSIDNADDSRHITLADGRSVDIFVRTRDYFEDNVKNSRWLFNYAIDYDIIKNNLFVLRNRREGDRIALAGRGFHSRVKKLMCDRGIPTELRDRLLILEYDGEPAWLERFGASERCRITEQTKRVLMICIDQPHIIGGVQ